MGIIPRDDEIGNDCGICYASGETPKLLKLCVSGVEKGQAFLPQFHKLPNGYFDAVQDNLNPCLWNGNNGVDMMWEVRIQPHIVSVTVSPIPGFPYFYDSDLNPCASTFENQYTWASGMPGCYGSAWVGTPAQMANRVKSITPLIDPDPRMELFPMANSQIVIRYAGKRDATNISIKLDTND